MPQNSGLGSRQRVHALLQWAAMDPNPYESPSADPLGTNTAVGGAVSPRVVSELTGTKPWVRFLAVLAFLGAGFTILAGLGVSAAMMKQMGPGALFIGVLYVLMGLIYIVPAIKLWKYGSAITQFQYSGSNDHLESALSAQRGFWKITGIMVIVGFVLVILFAVGMVIFGIRMASQDDFNIPLDGEVMEVPNFELE